MQCHAGNRSDCAAVSMPCVAPHPPMDVYERDGELVIVAQVPGRRLEDLCLEVHGDTLSLSCPAFCLTDEGGRRILEERRKGGFLRRIHLPSRFDCDRVTARLADGLLRIHVPARPGMAVEWTNEDPQPGRGAGAPGRTGMPEQSEEGNSSG